MVREASSGLLAAADTAPCVGLLGLLGDWIGRLERAVCGILGKEFNLALATYPTDLFIDWRCSWALHNEDSLAPLSADPALSHRAESHRCSLGTFSAVAALPLLLVAPCQPGPPPTR